MQTLGSTGRLCGAIAWVRDTEFGALDRSVMTVLAALAEVSLEQTENLRVGHRAILEQLFQLLKDGRVDSVRRAVRVAGIELPAERFAVAALDLSETSASVRDVLERRAARADSRTFAVADGRHLLVLIDAKQFAAERRFFGVSDLTVGLSAEVGWPELTVAITQAVRSLHRHGLKSRMQRLSGLTNLSLDTFQGRAELWAMLAAIDLSEKP